MKRFPGRTVPVVCGLLLLLVVSGCSFLSGIRPTASSLQDAGYQDVGVNISTGSGAPANGAIDVSYGRGPTGNDQQDARHAEQIVWDSLRYRFGGLAIVKTSGGCTGPVCVSSSDVLDSVTYAQLAARFGPRPPGLDATSAAHAISVPRWAPEAGLAVLLIVTVAVAALVMRSRKRRSALGDGPRYTAIR